MLLIKVTAAAQFITSVRKLDHVVKFGRSESYFLLKESLGWINKYATQRKKMFFHVLISGASVTAVEVSFFIISSDNKGMCEHVCLSVCVLVAYDAAASPVAGRTV